MFFFWKQPDEGGEPLPIPSNGLAIWLDAQDTDTLTVESGLVAEWENKGAAGNAAAETGQPTYVADAINGYPAVRGFADLSNTTRLAIPDGAALKYTEFTSFVVAKRHASRAALENIVTKYSASTNEREQRITLSSTGQPQAWASTNGEGGGVSSTTETATTIGINAPFIVMSSYDGADLAIQGPGAGNSTSVAQVFNGTAEYQLFAEHNSFGAFAGDIGEHIFYTRSLSPEEVEQVIDYLVEKWSPEPDILMSISYGDSVLSIDGTNTPLSPFPQQGGHVYSMSYGDVVLAVDGTI